jgi:hypothetical protein
MEAPIVPFEDPPEKPIRVSARLSAHSVLSPEELQKTIGEVKTAAEEEQARLSHPLAPSAVWYRRPVVAGVLVLAAAGVWAAQLWAWRPERRAPSPAEREGGLRYQVVEQASAVEVYRERTGRLPRTLAEAGAEAPNVSYQVLDSATYRLVARDSLASVAWRSDSSLARFIGASALKMKEGPGR